MTSAYSVPEFCSSHRISRGLFYRLLQERRGPKIFKAGRRTLISTEAAAEWRARMEHETSGAQSGAMTDPQNKRGRP
jgi:hypothetical protein